MNWIKNSVVIVFSLIIGLVITEIALRVIYPYTPTYGSYFPRYLIDNRPSFVSGITIRHPLLPFCTRPNYSHSLSDLAYHPKPYKITLDNYGYRKTGEEYQHYDNVIVGDSVAFGSGVDDDQTVASILRQHSKVYNLSISGAGPAMYMTMIDSFLERKTTDKITILFFLGNDIRNLKSACWDGISECLPPIGCKITRKDVSASPENPPTILSMPILRKSFLAHYIYLATKRSNDKENSNIKDLHAMISRKAITDLKNHINRTQLIKNYSKKAINLLEELISAKHTSDNTKIMVNELINDIRVGRTENVFEKMRQVSASFINTGYYPIGKDMQNLVSYANYYAGYNYGYIDTIGAGYTGNLYNYISLLKTIGKKYNDLKEQSDYLIKTLSEMKKIANTENIERYSNEIQRILNSKERIDSCHPPVECDRMTIFLEYLSSLMQRGIEISVYLIPAEYQLKRSSKFPERINPISLKAQEKGINCIDLTPRFIKHYSNKQNNALYLDGAHFTIEGNEKVAEWIIQDTVSRN